jgi:nucleoside-diphosphate-sugar epimerase
LNDNNGVLSNLYAPLLVINQRILMDSLAVWKLQLRSPAFVSLHLGSGHSIRPRCIIDVAYGQFIGSRSPRTTLQTQKEIHNRPLRQSARAVLETGDTIAVVGATGGVGRLLVSRILDDGRFRVRALVRSRSAALACFPGADERMLTIADIDIFPGANDTRLADALAGVKAVVISTGTSAFPTSAWGPKFENSPDRVDREGTENIIANVDRSSTRRVVLVTSIGTLRKNRFPFFILNLFGVLDAKRAGELCLMYAAKRNGYNYAIIRAGRLIGGPHSNPGNIRFATKPDLQGIKLAGGDKLIGDISRTNTAIAVKYTLEWDQERDVDICVVNSEGSQPTIHAWHRTLEAF